MNGGTSSENRQTMFFGRAQLAIIWPDGRQEMFPLVRDVTRVGRDQEHNDLAAPADFGSVSREHMEIRRLGADYVVSDLGSANGVVINDRRVSTARLRPGDEIRIGSAEHGQLIRMRFESGTAEILRAVAGQTTGAGRLLSAAPRDGPYLRIRWPNGQFNYYALEKNVVLVGRAEEADLYIPASLPFVSARHFEVRREGDAFSVTDLKSVNGTLLNNRLLSPGAPAPLHHNAIIRIGDDNFGVSLGLTFFNPREAVAPEEGFSASARALRADPAHDLLIGRAQDCQLVLDAPDVSRRHARISAQGAGYVVEDLNSANGTFVNEQRVQRAELRDGDLIRISNYLLMFAGGALTPYQSNGMRLDVTGLSKAVHGRRGPVRILDDISLSVLPREFLALVGASGAGKTTLLNALVGIRPGTGQVKLNGHDFYKEYEQFRAQLGYVPQNDILHTTLTVERGLDYAARLRLPASVSAEERQRRIAAVLDTVAMNTDAIRKTRIGDLSGGQRKRVSIAAELLADPKLIYLDEATSGLDPNLEKKLMHTLRRMADEGRTVVLITHATGNIVQADHVAFLAQGKLVFFGTSQDALDFFAVDDFADIYEKIEQHGDEWRKTYQETKPELYQHYVIGRQATARAVPRRDLPRARFGLGDRLRQFVVLMQRSLSVLFSDPITLALMLLLLPMTGVLQLIIGSADVLTGNLAILADPVAAAKTMTESYTPLPRTNTFVFVMGLEAVLTGLFVPSNDLVRERSIFLRERMVNLKVLPYLLSKAAIYAAFVLIQVALYMLILSLGVRFPASGHYFAGAPELFITLFLTMMAGIGFGLIISAVSKSTEMSIYLLTMMLFFQFFFAGTVFDLRGNAFEPISYLSTTRWALTALGVTIDMPRLAAGTVLCSDVPANPLDPRAGTRTACANYAGAKDDLMLDYDPQMLPLSWVVLGGATVLFFAVTGLLLERTRAD